MQIWNGSDKYCWRYRAEMILSTDRQTDRWTDGQGDTSIPPFNLVEARGIIIDFLLNKRLFIYMVECSFLVQYMLINIYLYFAKLMTTKQCSLLKCSSPATNLFVLKNQKHYYQPSCCKKDVINKNKTYSDWPNLYLILSAMHEKGKNLKEYTVLNWVHNSLSNMHLHVQGSFWVWLGQKEARLYCNFISHWLNPYPEWSLHVV